MLSYIIPSSSSGHSTLNEKKKISKQLHWPQRKLIFTTHSATYIYIHTYLHNYNKWICNDNSSGSLSRMRSALRQWPLARICCECIYEYACSGEALAKNRKFSFSFSFPIVIHFLCSNFVVLAAIQVSVCVCVGASSANCLECASTNYNSQAQCHSFLPSVAYFNIQ